MASYEIPLISGPQAFSVSLAGVTYGMRLTWCTASEAWMLDVADQSGNTLVAGIPLITGTDLLGQHQHLGIGGSLVVQTDGNADAVPTFDNLGTKSHLYFVTP